MNNTSVLINMMEFVISMMIRLRDYAKVVERSATHDQLTNCKNRRAMQWVYDTEFDKEQSMMVMMCDLLRFCPHQYDNKFITANPVYILCFKTRI